MKSSARKGLQKPLRIKVYRKPRSKARLPLTGLEREESPYSMVLLLPLCALPLHATLFSAQVFPAPATKVP